MVEENVYPLVFLICSSLQNVLSNFANFFWLKTMTPIGMVKCHLRIRPRSTILYLVVPNLYAQQWLLFDEFVKNTFNNICCLFSTRLKWSYRLCAIESFTITSQKSRKLKLINNPDPKTKKINTVAEIGGSNYINPTNFSAIFLQCIKLLTRF